MLVYQEERNIRVLLQVYLWPNDVTVINREVIKNFTEHSPKYS